MFYVYAWIKILTSIFFFSLFILFLVGTLNLLMQPAFAYSLIVNLCALVSFVLMPSEINHVQFYHIFELQIIYHQYKNQSKLSLSLCQPSQHWRYPLSLFGILHKVLESFVHNHLEERSSTNHQEPHLCIYLKILV